MILVVHFLVWLDKKCLNENIANMQPICLTGGQWPVLICYERKILLPVVGGWFVQREK
jgi:hypothetical protein